MAINAANELGQATGTVRIGRVRLGPMQPNVRCLRGVRHVDGVSIVMTGESAQTGRSKFPTIRSIMK